MIPSARSADDILFTFSWADTWGDAHFREMCMSGDRLAGALIQDPGVPKLAVANPYRSWPVRSAKRLLGRRDAPFPDRPDGLLIAPTRLRRRHPETDEAIERLYVAYDRRLQRGAGRLGMVRPTVITLNPFVAAYSPLDWAGPATYYALDEWAAHPRHESLWPAFHHAYAAIRSRRRGVCAVSQTLLDRLAPTGPAAVVPNGVEPREWIRPCPPPDWFSALPAPRLLYVGSIDDRLDVDSLLEVADRFHGGSVTLLGLVTAAGAIESLTSTPNIRIVPPVGRKMVAAMIYHSDVCLLPHRRTALTESMSPLKLYEYLSGGRPVVASDLPPIRDIDARVLLVKPGERFSDGVTAALGAPRATETERMAFVDRHSWRRRHETILALARGNASGLPHASASEPTDQ